jgi:uncharacterized protein HemX
VCGLALAALLAIACVSAPAAFAATSLNEGGALSELTRGSETEEATETTATATSSSTSSSEPQDSSSLLLAGGGVAAVLLIGIVYVIMRDVRKVAPASAGDMLEQGTVRRSEAAMRRRRAKAKAARQQRKRNR